MHRNEKRVVAPVALQIAISIGDRWNGQRERERERERDGGGSRRQRDKGDTDASAFGPRRNEVISLMFLLGSRLPAGHDPDAFLAFS